MRLLLYSHAFAPSVGGVETITQALASGFARRGVEVTVATPTPAGGLNDSQFKFRVVRAPGLWQLVRLIREADVLHLAGPALAPLALGLLLRKPVAIEHHGFQSICPNGQLIHQPARTLCPGHFMAAHHRECLRCNASAGKLASLRMWALTFPRRWLCLAVSANIAPTDWLAAQLGLPRMTTIHHGLKAPPGTRNASPTPGATSFVSQGRLVSTKGADVALAAAALLKAQGPSFGLSLVGEGPDRRRLEALARELGIEGLVRFLGYLPAEALEQALGTANAILIPSLAGEVFGLIALENMLRGRLVIVSGLGALAEVVGDAGLICPAGDAKALAACMRRVIENSELCTELGRRARERAVKLFSDSEMIEKHLRLYNSLFEPGHGQRY